MPNDFEEGSKIHVEKVRFAAQKGLSGKTAGLEWDNFVA